MPIYEYLCYSCGLQSEELRSISQANAEFKCPDCGSTETKRAVSAPVVVTPLDGTLRGSGKRDLDRLIGADSETRHDMYGKEKEKRDDVRAASGTMAVGRNSDGSYVPMSSTQMDTRKERFETFEYAKETGEKVTHG